MYRSHRSHRSSLALLPLAALVAAAALGAGACGSNDDVTPTPDGGAKPDGSVTTDAGKDGASNGDSATPDASNGDGGNGDGAVGAHAEGWDTDYALPGLSGPPTQIASSIAVFGNRQVVVAGRFDYAGSVAAQNIAVWNGNAWSALGAGLPSEVAKLAAATTGEIYATLNVQTDGGSASQLMKWDKTAWSTLATTSGGTITALEVAANGTLYVGGDFASIGSASLPRIAKLVGTTWSAVATGVLPEGSITVVHANSTGAGVCLGGRLGEQELGVTCTEGTTWTPRIANFDFGEVNALVELGGSLYAAGRFMLSDAAQDDGGGFARWTGTKWELVGGGVFGNLGGSGDARAMTVSGTKIALTGAFPLAGGTFVRGAALFDTATRKWSDLNGGIRKQFGVYLLDSPFGFSLATDSGGEIYIGGTFSQAGTRNAMGLARWDGASWNPVDDPNATRIGLNGIANTGTVAADGSLYVGGPFEFVGGDVAAHHVARLTGKTWSALGKGLDGDVYGMTTKGTDLYVVGGFAGSDTIAAPGIAKWNGTTWADVAGGLDGAGRVVVLGPDGKLYVGGEFTKAGTTTASHIAAWDGAAWTTFGTGLDGDVRSIAFDAGGKLYVGGTFAKAGAVAASNVATWDGTAWKALGAGVDDAVDAMTFYDGKLAIGGAFEKSGAASVPHLAAWDGTAWTAIGGGLSSPQSSVTLVQGLTVGDGKLYAIGLIEAAGAGGATPVSHIARWDGSAWSTLAGGIDDVGEDVVATKDSVWAIGTFASAGKRGSVGVGRYWFGH